MSTSKLTPLTHTWKFRKDTERRMLAFRIVAAAVRARLDPEDAELVASWFDQLAAGKSPATVLGPGPGRPTIDHATLVWNMRRALAENPGAEQQTKVFKAAAKLARVKVGHMKNIYRAIVPTLAPDPLTAL